MRYWGLRALVSATILVVVSLQTWSAEFPAPSKCYLPGGVMEDSDISDERIAAYLKTPGVKRVFVDDGALAVEYEQPLIDEGLRECARGLRHSKVEGMQRPERQYLISASKAGQHGHGPEVMAIFEKEAAEINARGGRCVFVPDCLLVTRSKVDPRPGEHPVRYTRDLDTSQGNFDRLKQQPDVLSVKRVEAHSTYYYRSDLWAAYDRAKEANEAAKQYLLTAQPAGYVVEETHAVAPQASLRIHLMATYGKRDPIIAHIEVPKSQPDDHYFWREIIRWDWRVCEGDGVTIEYETKPMPHYRTARRLNVDPPESRVHWRTATGVSVCISWPVKKPRPDALLRAYLEKLPSALDKTVNCDRNQWALDELLLFIRRTGDLLAGKSEEHEYHRGFDWFPFRIPFLHCICAERLSRKQVLDGFDQLQAWAKTVKPDDLFWSPESGVFRLKEDDIARARQVRLAWPDAAVGERIAEIRPLRSQSLWQVQRTGCIATDRRHVWFAIDGQVFLFAKEAGEPRLIKLNGATGAEEGFLKLRGSNLDYSYVCEGRLQFNVSTERSLRWHVSVDPVTLDEDEQVGAYKAFPMEDTRAYYAIAETLGVDIEQLNPCFGREKAYAVVRSAGGADGREHINGGTLFGLNNRQPGVPWQAIPPQGASICEEVVEGGGLLLVQCDGGGQTSWSALDTGTGQPHWALPIRDKCVGVSDKRVLFYDNRLGVTVVDALTGRIHARIALPERPNSDSQFAMLDAGFVYASDIPDSHFSGMTFRALPWPPAENAVDVLAPPDPEANARKEPRVQLDPALKPPDQATMALLMGLFSKDRATRERAAINLNTMASANMSGLAAAIPTISNVLIDDTSPKVRAHCAMTLKDLGPAARSARPALLKATEDEEATVRSWAIEALVSVGLEPADVPLLSGLLRDRGFAVAGTAGRALGKMGEMGLPVLREALRDPIKQTRLDAADGLAAMGADAGPCVMDLVALLQDRSNELDEDFPYVIHLLDVIERIGAPAGAAIPAVGELLSSRNYNIRRASAKLLEKFGTMAAPARKALQKALTDEDADIRELANRALESIGGDPKKDAAPALKQDGTP